MGEELNTAGLPGAGSRACSVRVETESGGGYQLLPLSTLPLGGVILTSPLTRCALAELQLLNFTLWEKTRPATLVEGSRAKYSFLCVALSESRFPKPVLLGVPETLTACGQKHYLQFPQDNCFLCCHAPSLEIAVYPACPFVCSLNSSTRSVLSPYHISAATLYTLCRGSSCEHSRHGLCPAKV